MFRRVFRVLASTLYDWEKPPVESRAMTNASAYTSTLAVYGSSRNISVAKSPPLRPKFEPAVDWIPTLVEHSHAPKN